MDRLLSYRIASMFAQPVDPVRDACPSYPEVIRHPMDLGTISSKLKNNDYDTITQWRQDLNLVWENAAQFNGAGSLVTVLARQLQSFVKEWSEYITVDEKSDWINRVNDLRSQLSTARGQSPKLLQPQKVPKVKEQHTPGKPPKISRQASHAAPKQVPQTRPTPPTRSQSAQLPQKFTQDQIVQLTDDVNSLGENEAVMEQIVELIRKHEPHLMVGEEVEIEVSRLRIDTLWALRKLVDNIAR
jgi:hypothetical protein